MSRVVLLPTFLIGLVSGLRTFTGVAAVCWGAHWGWINLAGSPLVFMGSKWALGIFTVLALVEYVVDQLPNTAARTVPVQFGGRLVMGGWPVQRWRQAAALRGWPERFAL